MELDLRQHLVALLFQDLLFLIMLMFVLVIHFSLQVPSKYIDFVYNVTIAVKDGRNGEAGNGRLDRRLGPGYNHPIRTFFPS